ncbi:MAG: AraC family transcriptional regulator [Bacillota bacterium]|nr:AraC family transcriptional regulator [Bacillota bacterium]
MDIKSSEKVSDEYLELNSCDSEFLNDRDYHCLREHGRADYHILYIKQGYCYVKLDGQLKKAGEGSIVLFRPGQVQEYSFYAKDNSVSFYIHFSGKDCESILERLNFGNDSILYIGRNKLYEETFLRMTREYHLKQYMYNFFCSSMLLELLCIISRSLESRRNNVTFQNEQRINEACRIIYENYNKNISVNNLAAMSFLSVSRFSHLFEKITGFPPITFMANIRIEKAREMLLLSDMTISEIALTTGYSNQNYFCRIFKKKIGYSPTEYRRTVRNL